MSKFFTSTAVMAGNQNDTPSSLAATTAKVGSSANEGDSVPGSVAEASAEASVEGHDQDTFDIPVASVENSIQHTSGIPLSSVEDHSGNFTTLSLNY